MVSGYGRLGHRYWYGREEDILEAAREREILVSELEVAVVEAATEGDIALQVAIANLEAVQPVPAEVGLSAEGGSMASADTIQTMRASGGFTLPEGFKQFLPLLLAFILVVFILIKK